MEKKAFGKQVLVSLAVATVVIGASIAGVILPQEKKLEQLEADIVATQAELAENEVQAQIVPVLAEQVKRMKLQYKDFDRRLPKQDELGGFLETISAHLISSELVDELIERKNPIPGQLFYTLPVSMRLRGSYLNVAQFLDRLEKMERLAKVERMRIHRKAKDADLDVRLQINIYFTAS